MPFGATAKTVPGALVTVEESELAPASTIIKPAPGSEEFGVLPMYSHEFCGLIIMELGRCGSVIAVPSVLPLMGNNLTCGAAPAAAVLHAFGAGVVVLQVT